MSEETARLFEVLGTWFSGLGTMVAVIVSLYLARRQESVNVKVTAGRRQIVHVGMEATPPEFVCVKVVNRGYRPVTISHLGWRTGLLRKRNFVQILHPRHPMSHEVPITLDHGREANFFIPLDEENHWLSNMAADIDRGWTWLTAQTLRVSIGTTVGVMIYTKVEPELLDDILKEAKRKHGVVPSP